MKILIPTQSVNFIYVAPKQIMLKIVRKGGSLARSNPLLYRPSTSLYKKAGRIKECIEGRQQLSSRTFISIKAIPRIQTGIRENVYCRKRAVQMLKSAPVARKKATQSETVSIQQQMKSALGYF